jgi:hypothetical protein
MTQKPRTLRKIALIAFWGLFFLASTLLLPASSSAQFLGYTSPQTVYQSLAPSTTACTGSTQIFPVTNLGQTQHVFTIVPDSNVTSLQMKAAGIDSNGNLVPISDTTLDAALVAATVNASGSFPIVEALVTCNPAATGHFTLSYQGASSTVPVVSGAFLQAQINKTLVQASGAVDASLPFFPTPYGNSSSTLIFHYQSSPVAGGTVTATCITGLLGENLSVTVFSLANNTSLQLFNLPAGPCPQIGIVYGHGGAAGNILLEQTFNPPGLVGQATTAATLSSALNASAAITEKGARWDVFSTPAAGSQGTASKAAGTTGVRHVADCVSFSAGAIAAPAATALQVNLRDGASGAGTVIWSQTVTIPNTAAPHYSQNFCGLNLIGTAATAMTLEFSAALASESESVTLTGYDVQ